MRRGSFQGIQAAGLALAASLGLAGAAAAQAAPEVDEFSTVSFVPAPGPGNFLGVDGALVRGHVAPWVGLTLDYAHEPFVLYTAECDPDGSNCEVTGVESRIVAFTALAHVQATLALFDRLQVGVVVPLGFVDGETFAVTLGGGEQVSLPGGSAFVVADPRLHVKLRLVGAEPDVFRLGLVAWGSAPVGQAVAEGRYVGDATFGGGGHLIAELAGAGLRFAVNVGGRWRDSAQLFSTEVGPQLTYAGALGYDVTPLFAIFGEVQGATAFGADVDENPLEGRLGLRFHAGDFAFTLAGGAGVRSGVGTPVFRGLAGVAWSPLRGDADGDGVPDDTDTCPTEAEDRDGYFDEDGCPEADNDGDGLADGVDPCPDEAEDVDSFEDDDGCPDPDNDGDGILDGYDSCVDRPEDVDGDRDEDGCPDDDADRDGVPDAEDQCPNEAEDTDGYGDLDGCPEDDFDGDGLLDDGGDFCPDQPETFNGVEDGDGCPEADGDGDGVVDRLDACPTAPETFDGRADLDGCPDGSPSIELRGTEIVLLEPVAFDRRGAARRADRRILGALGVFLRLHPELGPVLVTVRAPTQEDADARAAFLTGFLVQRTRVPEERLAVLPEVGDDAITVTTTPLAP